MVYPRRPGKPRTWRLWREIEPEQGLIKLGVVRPALVGARRAPSGAQL